MQNNPAAERSSQLASVRASEAVVNYLSAIVRAADAAVYFTGLELEEAMRLRVAEEEKAKAAGGPSRWLHQLSKAEDSMKEKHTLSLELLDACTQRRDAQVGV